MRFLVVAAHGELAHRPLACLAGVADHRGDTGDVEEEPLADAVRRGHEATGLDARAHLGGHGEAGHDDVGAAGIQAGDAKAFLRGEFQQRFEDVLDLVPRHAGAVHRVRHLEPLPGEEHPGEVGERAAGSYDLGATPVAHGNRLPQLLAHRLAQLLHALGRRPVAQELLGEAHGAERQRHVALDNALGGQRELQRTAADVHDDRATASQVEMGQRAAEGQPGLLLSVEHAHPQSRLLANAAQEDGAVGGAAHGGGGHGFNALAADLLGQRRHSAQRLERQAHRLLAEFARLDQSGLQARCGLHLVDHPDASGGRDVGHDLADRVGADVDGRDALVALGARSARRGARVQVQRWRRWHAGPQGKCFTTLTSATASRDDQYWLDRLMNLKRPSRSMIAPKRRPSRGASPPEV